MNWKQKLLHCLPIGFVLGDYCLRNFQQKFQDHCVALVHFDPLVWDWEYWSVWLFLLLWLDWVVPAYLQDLRPSPWPTSLTVELMNACSLEDLQQELVVRALVVAVASMPLESVDWNWTLGASAWLHPLDSNRFSNLWVFLLCKDIGPCWSCRERHEHWLKYLVPLKGKQRGSKLSRREVSLLGQGAEEWDSSLPSASFPSM